MAGRSTNIILLYYQKSHSCLTVSTVFNTSPRKTNTIVWVYLTQNSQNETTQRLLNRANLKITSNTKGLFYEFCTNQIALWCIENSTFTLILNRMWSYHGLILIETETNSYNIQLFGVLASGYSKFFQRLLVNRKAGKQKYILTCPRKKLMRKSWLLL